MSAYQGKWPAKKIRETFIEFFEAHGHTHWPSSSVVPHEDPTLLFANAGMNQYKSIFLGTIDPKTPMASLKRACNSQKCIRAGGKHNDLDDVGKDLYHHTFFEMLGNWSFGDYFKEEAIKMAWECLTVAFGLDPERLYATYFGGDQDKAPGVPADEETRQLWLQYLPPERVLPFDAGDNFWEMGDTGPCGPCTEIHYDRIGDRDAAPLVNKDDPNVLEIWNNVFIQYNRDSSGLKVLPSQHVDTGMGFERLASILQGKLSNYDTDVFTPLFVRIEELCSSPPYEGLFTEKDTAYRVVADHVRTLSFAIADGAVPDNVGRGYVLRRVLRRAVWYAQRFLQAPKSFLFKVVPTLVDTMDFPELKRAQETIMAVLETEEADFNRTIDKGAKFFEKKANGKVFSGKDAFHLSGSLGFPLDLTQIMAEQRGMTVNLDEFYAELAAEKKKNELALAKRKANKSEDMTFGPEQTSQLEEKTIVKKYLQSILPAKIQAIFAGRGKGEKGDGFVDQVFQDQVCGVVLDMTSFYAEMGGQVADSGLLLKDDKAFQVDDVQAYAGYVLHSGVALVPLKVGDQVLCSVDYDRRAKIAPNHTATHMLNLALRDVLVGEVTTDKLAQRGSHVDDLRLRFDFAWDQPLTRDELEKIEAQVRADVKASLPVDAKEIPLDQAMAIHGLRCLKGESYPDPVRVVSIGTSVDAPDATKSLELCGGTHLRNTADCVDFALVSEEAIAKGVRRVVALTREKAAEAHATATKFKEDVLALSSDLASQDKCLQVSAQVKLLKNSLDQAVMPAYEKIKLRDALQAVGAKLRNAEKQILQQKADKALDAFETLATNSKDKKAVAARIDFGADIKTFGKLQKKLAKIAPTTSFLIISADLDKFAIYTTTTSSIDAKLWAQTAADAAGGGKGGGKPNAANFQVNNLTAIDAALDAAHSFLADTA